MGMDGMGWVVGTHPSFFFSFLASEGPWVGLWRILEMQGTHLALTP
jgi:hypothetical protein